MPLFNGEATARPRRIVRFLIRCIFVAIAAILALGLAYKAVPPVSTLMLARWATFRPVERVSVPLEAIAPSLAAAVIASEDARFCAHRGIDWGALKEVIEDTDDEGPSRGASTISMQTAKNLFLWPGRSYVRKVLELPIAFYIDRIWGKHRMMEVYLNIAEWGEGVFGAEAAARHHFGKSARQLTRGEAALLAAALPNPRQRDASRPGATHRTLANRVLVRMEGADRSCLQTTRSASRG